MARCENDPSFVYVDEWDELVGMLSTDYTLSTKQICKMLQCSRQWANRYVKPNVRHVYVSHGISEKGRTMPAVTLLYTAGVIQTPEAVWFSAEDFFRFVLDHASYATRSKAVWLENHISPDKSAEWAERCAPVIELGKELKELEGDEKIAAMKRYFELRDELEDEILPDLLTQRGTALREASLRLSKRTDADWVPVPYPNERLEGWRTVADRKDYGDVDEIIHRELFAQGAVRCELSLPDVDGAVSKKVYYAPDPEPEKPSESCLMGFAAVVPYKDWLAS